MQWRARSNPLAWWWALLTLVSSGNIALWFMLYHEFHRQATTAPDSTLDVKFMLLLCAAYVFGCAFRSLLPRADVQRICLFDTWLSSVLVGRSVATVAEVCFAMQWAMVLGQLGGIAGDDTSLIVAWAVVPLILAAQCCSWYGVLTTNYLANAIENSIWAVTFLLVGVVLCRLLPEFDGRVRLAMVVAIAGIASYLAFLMTIDVPMYLSRWRAGRAHGRKHLSPLQGLRDASTRWVVTHDFSQWKDEIAWMSLYFTAAVWASLALCLFYSFGDYLPRYRTELAAASWSELQTEQSTEQDAPCSGRARLGGIVCKGKNALYQFGARRDLMKVQNLVVESRGRVRDRSNNNSPSPGDRVGRVYTEV